MNKANYKQLIMEMLAEINNELYLKKIYDYIIVPYKMEVEKRECICNK